MSCPDAWRDLLLEAAYGALTGPAAEKLDKHLSDCAVCHGELASLRATLGAVERGMPRRPQEGDLDAWSKVATALGEDHAPSRPGLTLGYPLAAATAFLLIAVGVGLGRLMLPDPVSPPAPVPVQAQTATPAANVVPRYAVFLEQATPLLLAVANRGSGGLVNPVSFDAETEQRLAATLADRAPELVEYLMRMGRGREAKLIENLEVVFLQIANMRQQDYPDNLELVQATIEQRAILFQLTVEEMRLKTGTEPPLG